MKLAGEKNRQEQRKRVGLKLKALLQSSYRVDDVSSIFKKCLQRAVDCGQACHFTYGVLDTIMRTERVIPHTHLERVCQFNSDSQATQIRKTDRQAL